MVVLALPAGSGGVGGVVAKLGGKGMNEPADDYTEFLSRLQGETRQGWAIRDDGAADWALRMIARLQAQMEKRRAFVETEIERLKTWQGYEDGHAALAMDFFTAALRTYYDALKADGVLGREKHYNLPHGRLQERRVGPEYERDEAKILEWLGEHSPYRKVTVTLDWAALKAELAPLRDEALSKVGITGTGEVVPGVRLTQPSRDVFSVKPS